jgi:hypothetical protein
MKPSSAWYRQQSEIAERKYQAVVWGRPVPRESPQSAAKSLYPAHDSSIEINRRDTARPQRPTQAPNSIASALYPSLRGR